MITTTFTGTSQPQWQEEFVVFVFPYYTGARLFGVPVAEMRDYHIHFSNQRVDSSATSVIKVAAGDTSRLCESPEFAFANSPFPHLFFDDDPLHLAVVLQFDGPSHLRNFTNNPAFFEVRSRNGTFPVLLPPAEGSELPRQARAKPKTNGSWLVKLDCDNEWQAVEDVVSPPPPEEENEVIEMADSE